MKQIAIGDARYRVRCDQRDGQWLARAEREDTGDPFGVECGAASEADAVDRLARWLAWQREHADSLAALQHAERVYHRTIAGSAFANPTEGPTAIALRKASLDAVEVARLRLDTVRARCPHTS